MTSKLTQLRERLASDPQFAAEVAADLERATVEAGLEHHTKAREARLATYTATRPTTYGAATLQGLYDQQNPNGVVAGFLDSAALTLWLTGPSGHGKSHAAWAVCNHAATETSLAVTGWNVPRLRLTLARRDAHERFDTGAAAHQDRITRRLFTADLLLLDDLGAELGDGFDQADWYTFIYSVVDRRVGDGLKTIVTSNAADDKDARAIVASTYGTAVLGRLAEHAWWGLVRGRQLRAHAPIGGGTG